MLGAARAAPGFLPDDEGRALHAAALGAPLGPWLEIGSYCGKSACYLGEAARRRGTVLFSVDHHRGSEENQPGEQYHDGALVDGSGRVDTLPGLRRTLAAAGLEDTVLPVVGPSRTVAAHWGTPLGLLFIDGGHSAAAAHGDYEAWLPHLAHQGLLLIHDVFPDPADGGRPPFEVFCRALTEGAATEVSAQGSLRVLRRL
ncbi:MAG TPA: class I SAM-dependent methyltransferase [Candidatus Dormibacteraeota bacterium]